MSHDRSVMLCCFNHILCCSLSGHDGEGQLLGCHKPQEDPQRLPRQDQVAEGSPRCRQRRLGQAVVSTIDVSQLT